MTIRRTENERYWPESIGVSLAQIYAAVRGRLKDVPGIEAPGMYRQGALTMTFTVTGIAAPMVVFDIRTDTDPKQTETAELRPRLAFLLMQSMLACTGHFLRVVTATTARVTGKDIAMALDTWQRAVIRVQTALFMTHAEGGRAATGQADQEDEEEEVKAVEAVESVERSGSSTGPGDGAAGPVVLQGVAVGANMNLVHGDGRDDVNQTRAPGTPPREGQIGVAGPRPAGNIQRSDAGSQQQGRNTLTMAVRAPLPPVDRVSGPAPAETSDVAPHEDHTGQMGKGNRIGEVNTGQADQEGRSNDAAAGQLGNSNQTDRTSSGPTNAGHAGQAGKTLWSGFRGMKKNAGAGSIQRSDAGSPGQQQGRNTSSLKPLTMTVKAPLQPIHHVSGPTPAETSGVAPHGDQTGQMGRTNAGNNRTSAGDNQTSAGDNRTSAGQAGKSSRSGFREDEHKDIPSGHGGEVDAAAAAAATTLTKGRANGAYIDLRQQTPPIPTIHVLPKQGKSGLGQKRNPGGMTKSYGDTSKTTPDEPGLFTTAVPYDPALSSTILKTAPTTPRAPSSSWHREAAAGMNMTSPPPTPPPPGSQQKSMTGAQKQPQPETSSSSSLTIRKATDLQAPPIQSEALTLAMSAVPYVPINNRTGTNTRTDGSVQQRKVNAMVIAKQSSSSMTMMSSMPAPSGQMPRLRPLPDIRRIHEEGVGPSASEELTEGGPSPPPLGQGRRQALASPVQRSPGSPGSPASPTSSSVAAPGAKSPSPPPNIANSGSSPQPAPGASPTTASPPRQTIGSPSSQQNAPGSTPGQTIHVKQREQSPAAKDTFGPAGSVATHSDVTTPATQSSGRFVSQRSMTIIEEQTTEGEATGSVEGRAQQPARSANSPVPTLPPVPPVPPVSPVLPVPPLPPLRSLRSPVPPVPPVPRQQAIDTSPQLARSIIIPSSVLEQVEARSGMLSSSPSVPSNKIEIDHRDVKPNPRGLRDDTNNFVPAGGLYITPQRIIPRRGVPPRSPLPSSIFARPSSYAAALTNMIPVENVAVHAINASSAAKPSSSLSSSPQSASTTINIDANAQAARQPTSRQNVHDTQPAQQTQATSPPEQKQVSVSSLQKPTQSVKRVQQQANAAQAGTTQVRLEHLEHLEQLEQLEQLDKQEAEQQRKREAAERAAAARATQQRERAAAAAAAATAAEEKAYAERDARLRQPPQQTPEQLEAARALNQKGIDEATLRSNEAVAYLQRMNQAQKEQDLDAKDALTEIQIAERDAHIKFLKDQEYVASRIAEDVKRSTQAAEEIAGRDARIIQSKRQAAVIRDKLLNRQHPDEVKRSPLPPPPPATPESQAVKRAREAMDAEQKETDCQKQMDLQALSRLMVSIRSRSEKNREFIATRTRVSQSISNYRKWMSDRNSLLRFKSLSRGPKFSAVDGLEDVFDEYLEHTKKIDTDISKCMRLEEYTKMSDSMWKFDAEMKECEDDMERAACDVFVVNNGPIEVDLTKTFVSMAAKRYGPFSGIHDSVKSLRNDTMFRNAIVSALAGQNAMLIAIGSAQAGRSSLLLNDSYEGVAPCAVSYFASQGMEMQLSIVELSDTAAGPKWSTTATAVDAVNAVNAFNAVTLGKEEYRPRFQGLCESIAAVRQHRPTSSICITITVSSVDPPGRKGHLTFCDLAGHMDPSVTHPQAKAYLRNLYHHLFVYLKNQKGEQVPGDQLDLTRPPFEGVRPPINLDGTFAHEMKNVADPIGITTVLTNLQNLTPNSQMKVVVVACIDSANDMRTAVQTLGYAQDINNIEATPVPLFTSMSTTAAAEAERTPPLAPMTSGARSRATSKVVHLADLDDMNEGDDGGSHARRINAAQVPTGSARTGVKIADSTPVFGTRSKKSPATHLTSRHVADRPSLIVQDLD